MEILPERRNIPWHKFQDHSLETEKVSRGSHVKNFILYREYMIMSITNIDGKK